MLHKIPEMEGGKFGLGGGLAGLGDQNPRITFVDERGLETDEMGVVVQCFWFLGEVIDTDPYFYSLYVRHIFGITWRLLKGEEKGFWRGQVSQFCYQRTDWRGELGRTEEQSGRDVRRGHSSF